MRILSKKKRGMARSATTRGTGRNFQGFELVKSFDPGIAFFFRFFWNFDRKNVLRGFFLGNLKNFENFGWGWIAQIVIFWLKYKICV